MVNFQQCESIMGSFKQLYQNFFLITEEG